MSDYAAGISVRKDIFSLSKKRVLFSVIILFLVSALTVCSREEADEVSEDGPTVFAVSPKDTDSSIDNWLDDHYVCFNPDVPRKDKLYLHYPGTTDIPVYSQLILKEAADLGFHAVGLCYPNSIPLWNTCGNDPNPDAFENVRMEILDGIDRSERVDVSPANCILNRLVKLLQYLHALDPEQGWDIFLWNGRPVWSNILVGGHSQGGGHAAMAARVYVVARVLMFASPGDYNMVYDEVAPWIPVHATPLERYVGFYHIDDAAIRFNKVWTGLGLDCSGDLICVDNNPRPYGYSHCLFTTSSFPPGPNANPHNCIIRDENTPMSDGEPLFKPVWRYMLTGE